MILRQDNITSISNLQTFGNQKRTGTYHNAIHASSLFLRERRGAKEHMKRKWNDPSETFMCSMSCVTI